MSRAGTVRRDRRGRSGYTPLGPSPSEPLIERINARVEALFRAHGRRISRHQISTLLICSLVITSLFYPAVGIYFWASKGGPGVSRGDAASLWRSLSTPFMDSFSSSGRRHINSLSDLRMIWDDAKDLTALDIRDAERMNKSRAGRVSPPQQVNELSTTAASDAAMDVRPLCRTVRVEHVFVTTDDVMSGKGQKFGILERPLLQSALKLQLAIEAEMLPSSQGSSSADAVGEMRQLRCIQPSPHRSGRIGEGKAPNSATAPGAGPQCLTLSPLDYWQGSQANVARDDQPATTLARSSLNATRFGIPLSVSTTLAGRWHLFKKMPRAEYLALTFFLEEQDDYACGSETTGSPRSATSQSHIAWHDLLTRVTSGQVGLIPSEQGAAHELLLEFSPRGKLSAWRTGHVILLAGYALVLVYVSVGLVKMRKVHSRFGLAFSGITELIIGMVMSISICALLGIRLTLVPWELLPFVVVVVGSENMFVLTSAIVSTPISLTVPARIAHGLSKVGGPIAMTTVADMALLSFIALSIGVRAVQEFCIFAIFSLVMDFFLQMTFFVTILSIDMQRLELADLLTQGARTSQAMRKKETAQLRDGSNTKEGRRAKPSDGFIKASFKAVWKARTARTASLALITGFLGGLYLYYGTGYPTQQPQPYVLDLERPGRALSPASNGGQEAAAAVATGAFDPFAHLDMDVSQAPWWTSSPSADLWLSLNPQGASELRVIVEPWTILSLRSGSGEPQTPSSSQTFAGWALFRPRVRAIIWFAKLVVLPISGTTVLLWMLLLYLLKDTELLDAQRDKSEAEDDSAPAFEKAEDEGDDGLQTNVTIFAGIHGADVEFITESDGVVVSVDTDSCLCVWRAPGGKELAHGDADWSSECSGERAKLVAIRAGKEPDLTPVTALAVNTASGLIVIGLTSGRVCFVSLVTLKLLFEGRHAGADSAGVQHIVLRRREGLSELESISAITVYRDGSAYEWQPSKASATQISAPKPGATWTAFDVTSTEAADTLPRSFGPFTPSWCLPTIALVSSDRRLEIVRQGALSSELDTIFELAEGNRAFFRTAVICSFPRRTPTGLTPADDDDDASILVTGQTDGVVRAWELKSGRLVCTMDLGDGPVTAVRAVTDDDQSSCTVAASTSSRVSLLSLGSDPFGSFGLEPSGSLPGSLNGFAAGSPVKNRTPNGTTHLTAPTFWGDSSAPTTPTSEMPNPPAYPISSHGSAAKMRRASGHGRDRSGMGSESSIMSGFGLNLPSSSSSGDTGFPDDRQLRLIGCIACDRGGCELISQSKSLVGVRRRRRPAAVSDSALRRRGEAGVAASTLAPGGGSPRWEMWTVDLRADLNVGRNGEIVPLRQSLRLEASDSQLRTAIIAPGRGSIDGLSPGDDRSGATSRLRFSQGVRSFGGAATTAVPNLAFTRLSPVVGAYIGEAGLSTLLFGFGGSIGCVMGKLGSTAPPTLDADAPRHGLAQRRSKSSGGSIIGANGGGFLPKGMLRR